MTLKEVLEKPIGAPFSIEAMVAGVEERDKKAGGKYLSITVQDVSMQLSSNIWDNYGHCLELKPGCIVFLEGSVDKPYKDQPQVRINIVRPIADNLSEYRGDKDFVPRIPVTPEDVAFILSKIDALSSRWKGLAKAIFGLNKDANGNISPNKLWGDFIEAPAAKKWHGNKVGGLIHHTIGVIKAAENIMSIYPAATIDRDMVLFCAIVHDIFKTKDYVWTPVIDYNPETLLDHRYAAVSYISQVNTRLDNIIPYPELQKALYMIASHHGEYGEHKCKSVEDWILHLADMIDAKIVASEEGK
jgi:3'-5' exoribonuclease